MRVRLDIGAEVDIPTAKEIAEAVRAADPYTEYLRAVKWMRIPELLSGTAAGGVLTLGETAGRTVGPGSGYAWSVRRLVVNGLSTSAGGGTPDIVNIYRGSPTGPVIWQLNGDSFGVTWGLLEVTLLGGENLAVASVGTFAATGRVYLSGEVVEVPQELLGRLAM